jgi:DNA-binding response OmpR family regulator
MDSQETILIVDDEPSNVDMLSQELSDEGYQILTALDGEEALIKVQEHPPDLILLDIMMPKVDGFTTCRILKGSGKTILVPIILLTALRSHEDRIKGIDAGADDFISKPFDPDELLSKIRSLLRQKKHREEQEHELKSELEKTKKDLEQAHLELAQAQRRIEMLEQAKEQLSKFVPVSVRRMAETDPELCSSWTLAAIPASANRSSSNG